MKIEVKFEPIMNNKKPRFFHQTLGFYPPTPTTPHLSKKIQKKKKEQKTEEEEKEEEWGSGHTLYNQMGTKFL